MGVGEPRGTPQPLRPRGGFGGYLHQLRRERGLTIRQLAAAAGVHHTYISKLERGDRQAPDDSVIEALAAALGATPAQVDQLRWRAGAPPRGHGAPSHDDPTLTLVAEALGDPSRPESERSRLRQVIAQLVAGHASGGPLPPGGGVPRPQPGMPAGTLPAAGGIPRHQAASPVPPPPLPGGSPPLQPSIAPVTTPDGRATLLAGLISGWQTLDEAAAELRVTPAYLWELVQLGQLRAWVLPGAAPGSAAGVRLRRDDVLALLQPVDAAAYSGNQVR